jgi:hypothetical protein
MLQESSGGFNDGPEADYEDESPRGAPSGARFLVKGEPNGQAVETVAPDAQIPQGSKRRLVVGLREQRVVIDVNWGRRAGPRDELRVLNDLVQRQVIGIREVETSTNWSSRNWKCGPSCGG